jgi:hypothetical protein
MTEHDILRYTLATLAYRGGKSLRGAPLEFRTFRAAEGSRTPGEILAHLCDLMDWSNTMLRGREAWHDTAVDDWQAGVDRFFAALEALDGELAASVPLPVSWQRLFHGPIADALTHVGQIAMLRRMAGVPIRGENYSRAEIVPGRVGADQTPPKREFD